jgi:hypothetical protein
MTCIIAGLRHLRESSSVEALQKPDVRSRDVWMISAVLKIREEQRSSAEQMRTIIHPKLPIIRRRTPFHQITSHPCSKDYH